MKFSRILLTGLGAQMIVVGGLFTFLGLGGSGIIGTSAHATGMMDVANSFLPIWLTLCIAGLLCVHFALEARPARRNLTLLALAAIVVGGVPMMTETFYNNPVKVAASGPPLRIIQLNAFAGNFRPRVAVDVLLRAKADVVTLQEPRKLQQQMDRLSTAYPYHTECVDDCGMMILSKSRPISMSAEKLRGFSLGPVTSPSDGDVDMARMTLRGPDGKPFNVVSIHYHWPIPPQPFRRGQDVLNTYLQKFDRNRLILTGDFNLVPWSFTMRQQDRELAPLVRVTRNLFTWPAYVPRVGFNWPLPFAPIDHVYVGPVWTASRVDVMQRVGSDHFPVLVDLHFQPYNATS
ncbi:MAG: endonuclease/exonuclease/phosphatase family protein [Sphingobium sp.]